MGAYIDNHQIKLKKLSMSRFANAYWSPDYRTGIEQLSTQLLDSLKQLHELRRFIFNYMNYHHSNSGYMAKLAKESLPLDSSFRAEKEERRILSGTRKTAPEQKPKEIDVNHVFKEFVDRTALELQMQLNLASEIESEVLGKITGFIKLHEPQIKTTIDRFYELLEDYDESRQKMERTKGKYDEMVRLGELEGHDHKIEHEPEESFSSMPGTPEKPRQVHESEEEILEDGPAELNVSFPLLLGGGLKFDSKDNLQSFLGKAIATITTVKRKIPFPGYRNEIFSSDQLCTYLKTHRPHGFNPTRSSLEKLGQSLIDKKIIIGSGLFSQKFKSEGMWFEWSQEAVNTAVSRKRTSTSSSTVTLPTSQTFSHLSLEETSRNFNDAAGSTSRRFNLMFKNVKSSLLRPKYSEEGIHELEAEYNEAYEDVQKIKHLLDVDIFNKSQIFERFEKVRIEVIYQSLTKLLEVLYKNSSMATTSLHDFTSTFIEKFNKPNNYEKDLKNLLLKNSTGIYFPAIVLPHQGKEHFDPSLLNTSFQNIKFTFNLYKDIPLQVKSSDVDSESLLSTRSLPLLLKSMVEATFLAEKPEMQELWLAPIDHQGYWLLKHECIELVQKFEPGDDLNIQDEKAVEVAIVQTVVKRLSDTNKKQTLNFLRNWLLETSDSVIPCTVYDSLLNSQKSSEDKTSAVIKILTSIPRSNLCSLLFLLETISFIFDLQTIDEYGLSDDVIETERDKEDLELHVQRLNSMETIGSVPFLHLIFRPSVVKNAGGFKPPQEAYNSLLGILLDVNVREKLCIALISNEKNFLERTKRQEQNLGLNRRVFSSEISTPQDDPKGKDATAELKKVVSSPTPKNPHRLSGDNFSLRPFRTGTTPRPSPISSPVHTRKSSERSRNRSDSNHLISINKGDDEEDG